MAKKKKRTKRSKSKSAYKLKLKKGTAASVSQIVFLSLAFLVLVSFSRQGLLLVRFNDLLIKFFSWTTIFLPFIFISFALLISKVRSPLSQPNVVVGSVLFFVSIMSLTKSGELGLLAWSGMSTLITGFGAFIVLFGTMLVGLIVLFNTSFDQVFEYLSVLSKHARWHIFGITDSSKVASKGKFRTNFSGKEITVKGGSSPQVNANMQKADDGAEKEEVLTEKLVSNAPGEDRVWKYPSLDILSDAKAGEADRGDIKENAAIIEHTLESFGITAKVVEVNLGPAVTQYALEVALGTKLSKITSLERDMALALAAPTGTIRIEAPIPGRSLVGIELPNRSPEFVPLRTMMTSGEMKESKSKLSIALGLDVSGKPVVADLSRMPHVLIAGQTGSGKSVCINTVLNSLLFRATPSEVKLILVDPKRVELTGYNDIPHLLSPVIVEPEKVVSALRWVMAEMDRRYKSFAQAGVRNISGYNEMSGFQALPYIVVVIDELADVMLFSPVEVEDAITRIAQMSRATGIHMILATQRPSVDVITGLIKANIPTRIAFAVSSQVDSRVILDTQGAEKLLGKGDMLYLPPEQAKPMRIQGAFLTDKEITDLTSFIKNQGVQPNYTEEVTQMGRKGEVSVPGIEGDVDDKFQEAVKLAVQYDKASASLLQRRLSVGYARAARILDQLEAAGVVSPAEGSKPRDVLIQNVEQVLPGSETS